MDLFPIFSGVEGRDWTQSYYYLDGSRLSINHSKLIPLFVIGESPPIICMTNPIV